MPLDLGPLPAEADSNPWLVVEVNDSDLDAALVMSTDRVIEIRRNQPNAIMFL